jgi:hypothetical protein
MSVSNDPLELSLSLIRPKRLRKNIVLTMRQVIVFAVLSERSMKEAKIAYYKSMILLAASMVEALAHLLLKQALKGKQDLPFGDWEYKEAHLIKQINSNHEIVWCKRKRGPQRLSNGTPFKSVNKFCLELRVIPENLHTDCEKVRNLRNKIHLMGLSSIDRNYKKADAEFVLSVALDLIKLLKARSAPTPSVTP